MVHPDWDINRVHSCNVGSELNRSVLTFTSENADQRNQKCMKRKYISESDVYVLVVDSVLNRVNEAEAKEQINRTSATSKKCERVTTAVRSYLRRNMKLAK